jgi:hypothetical protein
MRLKLYHVDFVAAINVDDAILETNLASHLHSDVTVFVSLDLRNSMLVLFYLG